MIIEGIPSGDLECWCFLVDAKTFTRIKGEAPDEEFDVGRFSKEGSPYRYKLYPSDLIGYERDGKTVRIKIEVTSL